jgi:hypothetical protein
MATIAKGYYRTSLTFLVPCQPEVGIIDRLHVPPSTDLADQFSDIDSAFALAIVFFE